MTSDNFEIFCQVLQGLSTRTIADRRCMSQSAVCNHLARACQNRPGLHDALKLVRRVLKHRGRTAGR